MAQTAAGESELAHELTFKAFRLSLRAPVILRHLNAVEEAAAVEEAVEEAVAG